MQAKQSITLIRHGPPAVSLRQRVRGNRFRAFVEQYDAAKVARRAYPPSQAMINMAQADWVFVSHRPRALHTAELLGMPARSVVDAQFREIEFPVDFPRYFRFSALTWTAIALTLWRLGYSRRCEPFGGAKARARTAADRLEAKSQQGSVVLVAHGGINRLIAQELRLRGWRGPRLPRSYHWGSTTYIR